MVYCLLQLELGNKLYWWFFKLDPIVHDKGIEAPPVLLIEWSLCVLHVLFLSL